MAENKSDTSDYYQWLDCNLFVSQSMWDTGLIYEKIISGPASH